ncbi:leucine--tRNA ligase [Anaerocolumna cellulosilytica]|uniref:Leucine--tRNA ligase n=1 Tax=Anaerocolumna cellulosilytica TaxID=433286 RepID=A0A6S6R7E1_9FIRM|nr:leucine--tRNA ligase [Anaerocolumna cellulosilytica]MBB5197157.1 leucyl-tRNA synthetase [Anaerocolumna cellulosilytica]BCJ95370.1 leucine--tRNA ligase [Anaerocolumna cellulosilytica]
MTEEYSPKKIEKKWQDIWDNEEAFKTGIDKTKPKFYALVEFPYPSGQGLHVGHPRPYTALDIIARKRRLEGYNVLYPMGWDAFGLPTENYAIKNKIHPQIVTENNIKNFKNQLKSLGYSFDWNREINTTDPNYYKWTQWIFLKLFEKGLAYKAEMPINWCTSCQVGLANEEVVNGVCERCGSEVVHRVKSQWMLKITEYADRLIDDLDLVDFLDKIKTQQKNWIGRSEGAEIDFKLSGKDEILKVFTTRPDTLFGATYMVISPEHKLIDKYREEIENWDAVMEYREMAAKKSDFERMELAKDKTGVVLKGLNAINPATGKEIPIWISDYVLMSYGTGAIMAVPAHDTRDWEFAKKFNLPIIPVIEGGNVEEEAFTDYNSTLINSDFLNGLKVTEAKAKMTAWVEEKGIGKKTKNFKLRDWVFSRQRYWGEPIPLVHCEECGYVPVPENELPLLLPETDSYMPSDNGDSPLAKMTDWVETTCPKCGGHAHRETDTMPQWAGSSWYFLRYADPDNNQEFASKEALNYWLPVDWYNGGMEHTTLHLLYSRFWHKFLFDLGLVNEPEPYQKRTSHGMILGENNEKMSKSRGNVVNPDDIVREFGADTLRTYEMFIGAFELSAAWSNDGVKGCRRFLDRVWKLQDFLTEDEGYSKELEIKMHQTIKKVTTDYEGLKFNTAIAAMMALINDFYKASRITRGEFKTLLILLNPAAPHMTEELFETLKFGGRLYQTTWPKWEEAKTIEAQVEIAIQVNGKLKATLAISREETQEAVKAQVMELEAVQTVISGKTIVKEIYVKEKIYNIVVK